jgi:hypothetical protein
MRVASDESQETVKLGGNSAVLSNTRALCLGDIVKNLCKISFVQ